jgi:hypothetical protein
MHVLGVLALTAITVFAVSAWRKMQTFRQFDKTCAELGWVKMNDATELETIICSSLQEYTLIKEGSVVTAIYSQDYDNEHPYYLLRIKQGRGETQTEFLALFGRVAHRGMPNNASFPNWFVGTHLRTAPTVRAINRVAYGEMNDISLLVADFDKFRPDASYYLLSDSSSLRITNYFNEYKMLWHKLHRACTTYGTYIECEMIDHTLLCYAPQGNAKDPTHFLETVKPVWEVWH